MLTQHARLVVSTLVRAGVNDIVLCPGSRSTPLVLAAVETDAQITRVIDERSAAFFALGQARVTGRPTAVFCTSGTAPAHFYPAVLEAEAAGVPLVIVSADRPAALIGVGAPQTIDQRELFGRHVRAEVQLGLPSADPSVLSDVVARVVGAVARSMGPVPGPVHINVRADKPLEAFGATTPREHTLVAQVTEHLAAVCAAGSSGSVVADHDLRGLAARLEAADRPLIVAGTRPVDTARTADVRAAVASIARRCGAVVATDVTSQLRTGTTIDAADAFVRADDESLRPDFILRLGGAPTVTRWSAFFSAMADIPMTVLPGAAVSDPERVADTMLLGDVSDAVLRLSAMVTERAKPLAWRETWARKNVAARAAIDRVSWSEARATDIVVKNLPTDALLMAGNSLAVRHLDLYAPPTRHHVLSQRGVNGIDGLISGAAGSATAAAQPILLLLGDISFLHDIGGLAVARTVTTPLVIVVLDNRGGRIFEQLALAETSPAREVMDHFVTPHDFDLVAAAKVYGIAAHEAHDKTSLEDALESSFAHRGATVVVVTVPTDDAARQLRVVREETAR